MNKQFQVKFEQDKYGAALMVTHNGYQWTSIQIKDIATELPLIIAELTQAYEDWFLRQSTQK